MLSTLTYIISHFLNSLQTATGRSYNLPAHWVGGARAKNNTAHFASQNTHSVGAKSEGAAEGGCGRNSAAPERRSPAAPPEYLEGGTEQKNILFLFRRKNRARAKSRKRRIFFCEVAAGALAAAGRVSPFSARKRFAQRI